MHNCFPPPHPTTTRATSSAPSTSTQAPGPPGVGKTHLALRLAARLAGEGKFVRFRSELDFLAEEPLAASGEAPLPQYEWLVLDDGGKSRLTPFALERLYALVEGARTGRYDLSNHPPEA